MLLVLLLALLQAYALTTAWGSYDISISGNSISVTINTTYVQNVTGSTNPVYRTTLTGANATDAQNALSTALSNLTPGVSASNVVITSSSTLNTTVSTLKFNVNGATSYDRGALKINLAWKSFKITSNVTSGAISLNNMGPYLIQSKAWGNNSTREISWSYSEDGKAITPDQSVAGASSFSLWDFSQLSATLASWPHSLSVESGLTFSLSMNLNHNVTGKETVHDPTGPFSLLVMAGFTHKINIVVPDSPTIIGDQLIINSSSPLTQTMIALSIAFPIVGLAAILSERRLTSQNRARTSRKKNRAK